MAIGAIWGEIWNEAIWDTTIWSQVAVEPEVLQGGHFVPDTREERDRKKLEDARELRRLIEKAAGLIEEAEEAAEALPEVAPVAATVTPPKAVFVSQVADLKAELDALKRQIPKRRQKIIKREPDMQAARENLNRIIAETSTGLITQIAGVLEDLIREIAEDF